VSEIRLSVDMTRCEGSGMCALLFEEAIDLDRFGFPIVSGEPLDGSLARRALRAAKACPHGALVAVGVDGLPVTR
jgi:ferredoxin